MKNLTFDMLNLRGQQNIRVNSTEGRGEISQLTNSYSPFKTHCQCPLFQEDVFDGLRESLFSLYHQRSVLDTLSF